jgi:hypothetical protein
MADHQSISFGNFCNLPPTAEGRSGITTRARLKMFTVR